MIFKISLLVLSSISLFCVEASATNNLPNNFTIEGRLYDNTGSPLNSSSVDIMLSVLNQGASGCVLYRETYTGLDLSSAQPESVGVFSLRLGQAPTVDFAGTGPLSALFANGSTLTGEGGCTVTPSVGDHRVVRVKVKLSAALASAWETLSPDTYITPVPMAMVAESAQTLQGQLPTAFLLTNTSSGLTQANAESIFSHYAVLINLLSGTSTQYLSSSPSASVSFNGQILTNLAAPIAGSDAANKSYVDGTMGGKTVDVTGVSAGVGGGKILTWDQSLVKWVAQAPVSGVSSVIAGAGLTGGAITSSGTLAVDTGTTAGKIVQLNGSGALPAVDGHLLSNLNFPVSSVNGKTGAVVLNAIDLGLGTAANKDYGVAAHNLVELNGSAQLPAVDGSLLANVNAVTLQSRAVASVSPSPGQVLTWNASATRWEPQNASASGITDLTGDATAHGPGSTVLTIANGAITSAKLASGYSANQILITSSAAGNNITYANGCATGEILRYTIGSGWQCSSAGTVQSVVAGVGLVSGTITASGTLNLDVGVGPNKIVQFNTNSGYPAADGGAITNLNAIKLVSRDIANVVPADGQALYWNSTLNSWRPQFSAPLNLAGGSFTGALPVSNGGTGLSTTPSSGQILIGNGSGFSLGSLGGTTNQIVVTNSAGSVTLSTPQSIATTSNVAFNSVTTANLNLAAGSALSPAISFAGSTNSGIYAPNVGEVGVSTGGFLRMSFDNSTFHSNNTDGPSLIYGGNLAGSPAYAFQGDTATGWFHPSMSALAASTGATERMRIDASGNVGIGTTSPSYILDVLASDSSTTLNVTNRASTAARSPTVMVTNFDGSGNFGIPAFITRYARGVDTSPTATQAGDSIGVIGAQGYSSAGWSGAKFNAGVLFSAAGSFSGSSSPASMGLYTTSSNSTLPVERLHVDASGNIGVGTSNPAERLDIMGGTRITSGPTALANMSAGISQGTNTMNVTPSTANYPPSGTVMIGNEFLSYNSISTSQFSGLTHGLYGTSASSYSASTPVGSVQMIVAANSTSTPTLAVISGAGALAGQGLTASRGVNVDTGSSGSSNAYVVNLNPSPVSYNAGLQVMFKPTATNNGASTLNVNSLGAVNIQYKGLALFGGELQSNIWYQLVYDGTYFQIVSPKPTSVSSLSVTSAVTSLTLPGSDVVNLTVNSGVTATVATLTGCNNGPYQPGQTVTLVVSSYVSGSLNFTNTSVGSLTNDAVLLAGATSTLTLASATSNRGSTLTLMCMGGSPKYWTEISHSVHQL